MNIVITGASSGIGFELARRFAGEESHRVFVISRNKRKLQALQDIIREKNANADLTVIPADISREEEIIHITEQMAVHCRHIDILINNAGLLINKLFDQLSMQDWIQTYSTNVFGVAALTRALLPFLRSGELNTNDSLMEARAHIVNISSMGGVQGSMKFKGLSAYSSSKGALITLTECLAEEFRDFRIAANCLALGSVQTEMFSAAFPDFKASTHPAGIAAYIADFALKGARFYNGKVLPVSNSTP